MLEDTYGHTPAKKAFELGDVYGIGYDSERASRRKIRVGLIGAGGVVQSKHLPAIWRLRTLWEPVEVAAIAEQSEQNGKKVSELYGCRWYLRYEDLLANEELDAVIVASPDKFHYEHTIACLEHNIPVLVEKPIALSLVHAKKMCQLADEKGIPFMTVSNKRYSPPYRRAVQFVIKGPLTDPALFVGKFNLGYDYVHLLEQGTIHLFDLTRFFMGNVQSLFAAGVNKYARNKLTYPLDNAAITLTFISGAVGNINTSSTALSFKPWERVEIYGDKGWLAVEDQYELILYDDELGPSKHWVPVMPNTLIFDVEFGGFMGMIENFLQVIRGYENAVATGWDGYHAYELNIATHLSIANRTIVDLPLNSIDADDEVQDWLGKK